MILSEIESKNKENIGIKFNYLLNRLTKSLIKLLKL